MEHWGSLVVATLALVHTVWQRRRSTKNSARMTDLEVLRELMNELRVEVKACHKREKELRKELGLPSD